MSTEENDNDVLDAYESTLACYEQVESLLSSNSIKHDNVLLEHLRNCLYKVEYLISLEKGDNNDFIVPLLQIKKEMLSHIQKIQNKINVGRSLGSQVSQFSGKRKRTTNCDNGVSKRILNVIEATEEIPLVNGFHDIVGLWEVKKILKSVVILPQKQAQLFANGQFSNTILLYGPPGTGKTRIVHALAAEAKAKLFSISVGSILSSYVGQTEETIQGIFKYIKNSGKFSILFIDEIDGLCRKRTGNEQEYTRRIKTEFMCQLSQTEDCTHMYVICATNCPWDLDTAIRRRFLRSIYVPLPTYSERLEFFQMFMKDIPFENHLEMFREIIKQTQGFSGADLSTVIKHALHMPIIELQETKIWKFCPDGFYEPLTLSNAENIGEIICSQLDELPANSVRARKSRIEDFQCALDNITPTVSKEDIINFEKFSVNWKE